MATYSATSYYLATPELGIQPISVSSATQNHPLGMVVRATDATNGVGKFVYAQGVASTVQGSVVLISGTGATTLLSTSSLLGPVGVAMSANVASQYGWYQVEGFNPNVLCTSTGAAGRVYASATAGSVTSGSTASYGVDGGIIVTAVASGVAGLQLANPSANGNS